MGHYRGSNGVLRYLRYPKGTISIQLEMSKIKKNLQLTGWIVSNIMLCAAMVSPHSLPGGMQTSGNPCEGLGLQTDSLFLEAELKF